MDNVNIHRNEYFFEQMLPYYQFIYNAPYSPEMNPIEEVFAKWKDYVRK